MKRGDIVKVEFPKPSGEPGHEQFGFRPAVVIQADSTVGRTGVIVVVPLTSRLEALERSAFTIKVQPSHENGLARESVILVFQIRAIDIRRLIGIIGRLEDHHMVELATQTRRLLEL